SGADCDRFLHVTETVIGDVTVYGISAHSRNGEALHPDHGATLELSGDIDENDGYTAVYMYSEFWSRPYFGTDLSKVPDRTQGLIVKKKSGGYCVLLPMVSDTYKCDLKGGEHGLTAVLFSWYDKINRCDAPAFCYAEGDDPFTLLEHCAKAGMEVLGMGGKVRSERRYPEIFEYLGWCSWDAMQIRGTEEGLLRKCREFKEKNIPVRWAILDDMWADIREFRDAPYDNFGEMVSLMHSSSLYSFEADPIRFPNGLKHCIKEMNKEGMIVGMWHPSTGYWRGIDPTSPLFTEQKDNLVQLDDGRWIPSPEPGKAFQFYDAFHTFLQACGAVFVKVDNQSDIRRFYRGMMPVGQSARRLQTAIEASVGAHFGGDMINCMGMAGENMWNRQSSMISRCSDDFQPENRPWFIKHILQCSYNSLVQGQFYTCDWDMWWTDDGQAVKNSVLRAISGGPVYVSDKLDRSNREIFMPLVLDDGRLLRCDKPAVPVLDCLTVNPEESSHAFLVQNTCAKGEDGVIAAFDLRSDNAAVDGAFRPSDIVGLADAKEYAVYEHFTGDCAVIGRDDVYRFTLDNQDDYKMFIVTPVIDGVAQIGIIEKMVAPLTIARRDVPEKTEVKCRGTFAYVENGVLKTMEK
ncbi:MAG: hypothetical protein MJ175_13330, partial [Clostridia bacterium]|nr:hypothetical protein [Clostridia bacterium]